jgi:hypothetical protein
MPNTIIDTDDGQSLTIEQFCSDEQLSVPFYFKLRRQGKGPREIRLGRAVRITRQARRDWRRERENDNSPNAVTG